MVFRPHTTHLPAHLPRRNDNFRYNRLHTTCTNVPIGTSKALGHCMQHSSIFFSDNMRWAGVILALALAGIFGSSSASPLSAVAENTPVDHHKDLIDRYLQAISEQDGAGGAAAPMGDTSEENQSCFAGWDASCQDNPSFLSVMGASCKMHERFDCTMLHAIGYTELEVYAVVTNCPCACNVPCGQWTVTPSAAPSSMPSSTPSARPR